MINKIIDAFIIMAFVVILFMAIVQYLPVIRQIFNVLTR